MQANDFLLLTEMLQCSTTRHPLTRDNALARANYGKIRLHSASPNGVGMF